MQCVERHIIKRSDPRFAPIDTAAFAAKNLYNAANYLLRQAYIFNNECIFSYATLYHQAKTLPAYQELPRKVSQQVLIALQKNWIAFGAARQEWALRPDKFLGRPGLPRYLHKQQGRFLLVYTLQALSRPALRKGQIVPSGLDIIIQTRQPIAKQVRIVPKKTHYVVEVVYERTPEPASVDPSLIAGVDLGIDNLATIASNKAGFVPVIVHGRPLKLINQYYNKRHAELRASCAENQFTTHRLSRLTDKRNRRIDHELHVASRRIIELLVREGIGTLVIGKNDGWKQHIKLGKRSNQSFVAIPHARFIQLLTYKAELRGILVLLTEESHTSKCSFVDGEPVRHRERYVGKRVQRGLFRAANGRTVYNADVNGALNIIRKVVPAAFGQGIEGVVVHPVRLAA